MARVSWLLAFVVVLAIVGMAAAQVAPTAPAAAVPPETASALPEVVASEAPVVDLSQILAPDAGGISTAPMPLWKSCTFQECKRGCYTGPGSGCVSVCIDQQTCECDLICG